MQFKSIELPRALRVIVFCHYELLLEIQKQITCQVCVRGSRVFRHVGAACTLVASLCWPNTLMSIVDDCIIVDTVSKKLTSGGFS